LLAGLSLGEPDSREATALFDDWACVKQPVSSKSPLWLTTFLISHFSLVTLHSSFLISQDRLGHRIAQLKHRTCAEMDVKELFMLILWTTFHFQQVLRTLLANVCSQISLDHFPESLKVEITNFHQSIIRNENYCLHRTRYKWQPTVS
jgi:hypothetical protein